MPHTTPREITIAEIEQTFELASYWFGRSWCPAVGRDGADGGYSIRVLKSRRQRGDQVTDSYDYFELDTHGTVLAAPHGHARDFKPGRVIDIAAAADRFAEPQQDARHFALAT
jgi:hypothetical protein